MLFSIKDYDLKSLFESFAQESFSQDKDPGVLPPVYQRCTGQDEKNFQQKLGMKRKVLKRERRTCLYLARELKVFYPNNLRSLRSPVTVVTALRFSPWSSPPRAFSVCFPSFRFARPSSAAEVLLGRPIGWILRPLGRLQTLRGEVGPKPRVCFFFFVFGNVQRSL